MQQKGSDVRDACVRCVEIVTGVNRLVLEWVGSTHKGTLEPHAAHTAHTAHATAHASGRRLLLSLDNACLGGSEERGNAAAECLCQLLSNLKH
jgi:hypothetical protein